MIHSTTGLVHITSAILAMLFGAVVLFVTKGTKTHKRIGYAYVASMVILNITAFLIYDLFGKFGPFHFAAIFSSLSITGGMLPMFFRRQMPGWLYFHYYFMNWSVVGLYAAFWAETLTRLLPMKSFWPVVITATLVTTVIGSRLIRKHKDRFFGITKPAQTNSQTSSLTNPV